MSGGKCKRCRRPLDVEGELVRAVVILEGPGSDLGKLGALDVRVRAALAGSARDVITQLNQKRRG